MSDNSEDKRAFLLTISQVRIIGAALIELPFKVSAPIIDALQGQVNAYADAEKPADSGKSEPTTTRRPHRATKPAEPPTPSAPPADPPTPPAE